MKRTIGYLTTLGLLLVAVLSMRASTRALTNADIEKLLKSGLSQELIVEIIESVPGNYDTSENSIEALKRHGATGLVTGAMVGKMHSKMNSSTGFTTPVDALTNNDKAALVLNAKATSVEPETCGDEEFGTTLDCHEAHKTGCSHSDNPKYDAYLNLLKNRISFSEMPGTMEITKLDELERSLHDTLGTRNHASHAAELASLGEGHLFTLIGTLLYSISTDAETCNCQMSGSEDVVDFHIGLGSGDFPLSPEQLDKLRSGQIRTSKQLNRSLGADAAHALEKAAYIVEATPHYRAKHADEGWTLDRLLHSIGDKVRVTGQLMVDNDHYVEKDDCGLGENDTCWRKSVWEIHPITRFEVCNGNTCTDNSNDWIPLGQVKSEDISSHQP